MTIKDNINLSSVPIELLIAEIETRKDDEIRQLVTEINVRLNKLKILGYTPFDKEVVEQLDKTRLITGLGLNTDNNHRVLDVYFNTIKIED
jgi:hypothetical protein